MVVNSKRYSLFWPVVLIGAGVILLLLAKMVHGLFW